MANDALRGGNDQATARSEGGAVDVEVAGVFFVDAVLGGGGKVETAGGRWQGLGDREAGGDGGSDVRDGAKRGTVGEGAIGTTDIDEGEFTPLGLVGTGGGHATLEA